jgi:hypothetical protein
LPSNQRGDITQLYFLSKSRFCGFGSVCWFHGMAHVHLVAERIVLHEDLLAFPVVVVRAAEQDPDPEVDLDEVGRDELAVDHHAGRHEHAAAPARHVAVLEVAHVRVLERAPAAEQRAAQPDLLVAGSAW